MSYDQEKNSINQRFIEAIKLLVDLKKFNSPRELGLKYGIDPGVISDWKANRSYVRLKHIYNVVSDFPILNLDYILFGKGELKKNENILKDYQKSPPPTIEEPSISDLLKRIEELEAVVKKMERK
jgi:hypothetical protein